MVKRVAKPHNKPNVPPAVLKLIKKPLKKTSSPSSTLCSRSTLSHSHSKKQKIEQENAPT
ncbi:hypothetical protein JCM5350_001938, partial [Sporobolomyces pararoseus]